MKVKHVLETTDNPQVYKKVHNVNISQCPICSPNKGCNKRYKFTHDEHCWKSSRKHQWKV